jgi:hypothetical protein
LGYSHPIALHSYQEIACRVIVGHFVGSTKMVVLDQAVGIIPTVIIDVGTLAHGDQWSQFSSTLHTLKDVPLQGP